MTIQNLSGNNATFFEKFFFCSFETVLTFQKNAIEHIIKVKIVNFVCNITQPYIVPIKKGHRSQKDEIGPQFETI